jgi:hypothetical protein
MIDLMTAIQSLRPNVEVTVRGTEIEWHSTDITQPTDSEIQAEITRLQTIYDNNQYQRDRQYASTGDQLDMLWHTIDEGGTLDKTSEFYTANKAVKDANPKP